MIKNLWISVDFAVYRAFFNEARRVNRCGFRIFQCFDPYASCTKCYVEGKRKSIQDRSDGFLFIYASRSVAMRAPSANDLNLAKTTEGYTAKSTLIHKFLIMN